MTGIDATAVRPPGRPRCADRDVAILQATLEEYGEHGFAGLTIEGVAMRAGVGKATIYRRYQSKLPLVRDAMYWSSETKPTPDTGSLVGDLDVLLSHLDQLVHDPVLGPTLRHMAADSAAHADLRSVHDEFIQHRRAGSKAVFTRAIERGELTPDLDLELATDVLTGPVLLRHLMTHMPIDRAFLTGVRDAFIRLHAPR
jgi:AcrR family transcriptional regulator